MINPQHLHEVIQRSWVTQDWKAWRHSCAPDYAFDPGMGALRDVDGTMVWNRAFFTAFPDYTEEVTHVHIDVELRTVVSERLGAGTSTGPFDLGDGNAIPATGHRFQLPYIKVLEFDSDGHAPRDRQYWDRLALLTQLGLL